MRGGAGTALVGDPETVAARMQEYMALGIDTFILSGYPHLEEAYRFAELVFPLLPLEATTGRERRVASNERPVRRDAGQRAAPAAAREGAVVSRVGTAASCAPGPWLRPRWRSSLAWEAAADSGLLAARVLPAPSASA